MHHRAWRHGCIFGFWLLWWRWSAPRLDVWGPRCVLLWLLWGGAWCLGWTFGWCFERIENSFLALKLFWLQSDIIYTDMSSGGKCFGTKNIDNEREHEVAALVCGSCSLKSNMLSGVYAVYAGVVLHVHSHTKLFVMYACIYIYIYSLICVYVHLFYCIYMMCVSMFGFLYSAYCSLDCIHTQSYSCNIK